MRPKHEPVVQAGAKATAKAGAKAAPLRIRVVGQARFETVTMLRNGEQLLVSIILPALALVGLALSSVPVLTGGRRIDIVVPGVLALAVASNAFTGQAIATAFDRRYGVLRMYGVSPLGRAGLIGGKSLAVLTVLLLQLVILGLLGVALGWRPNPAGVVPAVVALLLGVGAFVGLGLLLAGTLRAEAVLAVANLLWIAFLGLGLLLPVSTLPDWASAPAHLAPSGALGESLRAALLTGTWSWNALGVLLAWSAVSWLLASRTFRWAP